MPLVEEVAFFMVWFDPDLPVLRIHLNNTGPTATLTARCYHAWIWKECLKQVLEYQAQFCSKTKNFGKQIRGLATTTKLTHSCFYL